MTDNTLIENNESTVLSGEKAKFYYSESLLPEHKYKYFQVLGKPILNYKNLPIQCIWNGSKVVLFDMSNNSIINEFPLMADPEFTSKSAYYIDDDLNIFTVVYYEEDDQVIIEKFDHNGSKIDVSVVLKDFQGAIFDSGYSKYIEVSKLKVDENYIYLMSGTYSMPTLQVFKLNGELYAAYELIRDFDVDKNGDLYIGHGTDNYGFGGFDKIDMKTKESIYQISADVGEVFYNEKGDFIYILGKDRINKYDAKDGKFVETVFTFGVDSSFFTDTNRVDSFLVDNKFNLYLSCFGKIDGKIFYKNYKYDFVEGVRPEKQVTLTVTSPYKQDFLSEAIIRYELKYPNQKVKYDYEYMSRAEFYDNEDNYGKKLITKILANDIGDIVLTGGSTLVFRNLFETDAFMDLSELIKNYKNYSFLNKAALKGITIDNAIRGLPVSIIYNFFEVNTALLEKINVELDQENLKWSDIFELLSVIEKKSPDSYLFITYHAEDFEKSLDYILEPMLIANMPDLIDLENREVDLNQEWFINLLEQLKKALSSKNFMQKDAVYSVIDVIHDALFNYRANIEVVRDDLFARYYLYNQKDKGSKFIPLFKGEKSDNIVAKSINMYSINNRSENKENVWKFLSFLMEEDTQSIMKIPGTAINLEVEKKVSEKIEKEKNRYKKGINGIWEMMEPIYTDIDYMYDLDYFKNDIKAPILEYLQDKISLEEAIKKAEDNVWIRLNE